MFAVGGFDDLAPFEFEMHAVGVLWRVDVCPDVDPGPTMI